MTWHGRKCKRCSTVLYQLALHQAFILVTQARGQLRCLSKTEWAFPTQIARELLGTVLLQDKAISDSYVCQNCANFRMDKST